MTRAPPALSAATDDTPDRASPKTATSRLAKARAGIIVSSPQLQRGKADERQHDGNDPEADDDRGFLPAQLLVVMMDRRHLEDALARHLEGGDLHDHRHRFHDEEPAY